MCFFRICLILLSSSMTDKVLGDFELFRYIVLSQMEVFIFVKKIINNNNNNDNNNNNKTIMSF